jgi:hypothetical protein
VGANIALLEDLFIKRDVFLKPLLGLNEPDTISKAQPKFLVMDLVITCGLVVGPS